MPLQATSAEETQGHRRASGHIIWRALVALSVGAFLAPTAAQADIFVSSGLYPSSNIGRYTLSGAPVNPSIISNGGALFAISGSTLFVSWSIIGDGGGVAEYNISGTPLQPSLITGLRALDVIRVAGSDLFIRESPDVVGPFVLTEYTTSGALVSPSVFTGSFSRFAVQGSDLFIATNSPGGASVSRYTTSGVPVTTPLISGLSYVGDMAVLGSDLFIADYTAGKVREYTLDGTPVNTSLISVNSPLSLSVYGSDIFVGYTDQKTGKGAVGEYTLTGDVVNASLITGLPNAGEVVVTSDGLLGDANDDGLVNFADFILLSNHFGQVNAGWPGGDFNNDGVTNFSDFVILSNNFGQTIGANEVVVSGLAAGVPEPASLILLGAGLLGLFGRGRTRRLSTANAANRCSRADGR